MNNNSVNNLFLNQKVVEITSDYTAVDNDVIIEVTNITTDITITLPAPSSNNIGKFYVIKDASGGASSINNILITCPSSTIDGYLYYTILSSYASVQVFSDGTNYFTYAVNPSPPNTGIPLATGKWRKINNTAFLPGATVTNNTVTAWDTVVAPLTSRLDLSGLTNSGSIINILVASDFRSISFANPGLYYIIVNCTTTGNSFALVQIILNGGTIISPFRSFPTGVAPIQGLQAFYIGTFNAGDVIDVRFSEYSASGTYSFLSIDFSIQQLPVRN